MYIKKKKRSIFLVHLREHESSAFMHCFRAVDSEPGVCEADVSGDEP